MLSQSPSLLKTTLLRVPIPYCFTHAVKGDVALPAWRACSIQLLLYTAGIATLKDCSKDLESSSQGKPWG